MKKHLLLLPSLLLLFTIQLEAQESIGFSDSTDFEYLIDYRLPDWGYSNFSISSGSFGFSGAKQNFETQQNEPGDPFYLFSTRDVSNRDVDFRISPRFELYRESEDKIIDFDSFISLGGSRFTRTIEDEDVFNNQINNSEEEDIGSQGQISNQTFLNLKNYSGFGGDIFFSAGLNTNVRYSISVSESNDDPGSDRKVTTLIRNVGLTPSIGIGFGRLRNVTPMIRALRVNERYKALGNSDFNSEEIVNTAETFTKIQGYQQTKDRFLKSFWGDINSGANGRLDDLGTFDLFYLNDVLNENLGQRFEGYSFSISGEYSYINNLRKDEEEINQAVSESRDFFIQRIARVNVDGDWYKNLNLYHQINISFRNDLTLPLEKDIQNEWSNITNLTFGWQWNFADRFQFNSFLENILLTEEIKNARDDDFVRLISELSGQFSYFIENRMSLSAGLALQYRNLNRTRSNIEVYQDQNEFLWTVNASVRYYFNRNLY